MKKGRSRTKQLDKEIGGASADGPQPFDYLNQLGLDPNVDYLAKVEQ